MLNKNRFFFQIIFAFLITPIIGCRQISENTFAFTHVNLIPMTSERVIHDQTVLVSGSEIIAIGNSDRMKIPTGTHEINGDGVYLMPGLVDMHMHTRADWEDREIWPIDPLALYLSNGVTTIRDFSPLGSPLTYALQWGDEIKAGNRIGPTIYASGKLLYASPLDDPDNMVRQNHDLGFDFIKLYSYLSKTDFQSAMAAAKTFDMYTTGHIPYPVGLNLVLAAGMDEIAHVEELLPEFFEFDREANLTPQGLLSYIANSALNQLDMGSSDPLAEFKHNNQEKMTRIANQLHSSETPVCTTMIVDGTIQLKLQEPDAFLARPENVYFEKGYLDSFHLGTEKHQVQCHGIENLCVLKYGMDRWILTSLHDAGVLLLLGTDSGTGGMGIVPGSSIHDELQILVKSGFSAYQAIATGTVNAGIVIERMTGDGNLGTIEVGNRADLILVRTNPLIDIATMREPLGVMAAGRWYPKETLDQMIDTNEIKKPNQ